MERKPDGAMEDVSASNDRSARFGNPVWNRVRASEAAFGCISVLNEYVFKSILMLSMSIHIIVFSGPTHFGPPNVASSAKSCGNWSFCVSGSDKVCGSKQRPARCGIIGHNVFID